MDYSVGRAQNAWLIIVMGSKSVVLTPKFVLKEKKKLGEKANKINESQLMAYGEKIVSHD